MKENAQYLDIKQRIRNGEGSENFMCKFYWKARYLNSRILTVCSITCNNFRHGSYTPDELLMYQIDGNNRNCWKRLLMRFATTIIRRFPYLHKMDNLMIDHKLGNVKYYTHNQDLVPILSIRDGKFQNISIPIEDLEKFNEIIKNRETRNAAVVEEELLKIRAEKSEQEIINLKEKLDLVQENMQKNTEMLLNFMSNAFTEMNSNFLMQQLQKS